MSGYDYFDRQTVRKGLAGRLAAHHSLSGCLSGGKLRSLLLENSFVIKDCSLYTPDSNFTPAVASCNEKMDESAMNLFCFGNTRSEIAVCFQPYQRERVKQIESKNKFHIFLNTQSC